MKITGTIPVNMSVLDNQILKKQIELPDFNRKIDISVSISFLLNQKHTMELKNAEIINDEKALRGDTKISIELELTKEEESLIQTKSDSSDPTQEYEPGNSKIKSLFISITNDLIDIFRLKTNYWWTERTNIGHIVNLSAEYQYSGSIEHSVFPGLMSMAPEEKEKIVEKINLSFSTNQELPIFIEYYLLSMKYMYTKRYDLASVFFNISVESFIFLLSQEVFGKKKHEELIAPHLCKECGKQIYKTPAEILDQINNHLQKSEEKKNKIKKLLREVRMPNKSNLRNDITHGKIVFIQKDESHKKNAQLAYKSIRALVASYNKIIGKYL